MNLSKIPGPTTTPPLPPPEGSRSAASPPVAGSLATAWVSLGIGVFVLLLQPRFLQWVSSRLFHTAFNEFQLNGQPVPYTSVPEFWADLGPTLFGLVLIGDAMLLFTRRRSLVWTALALTGSATAFNLGWVVLSYSRYGLAVVSLMAVIVGGYVAFEQWTRLSVLKNRA